jgi:hypothetical protein
MCQARIRIGYRIHERDPIIDLCSIGSPAGLADVPCELIGGSRISASNLRDACDGLMTDDAAAQPNSLRRRIARRTDLVAHD